MISGITVGLRFLATIIDLAISFCVIALSFQILGLFSYLSDLAGFALILIGFPVAFASPILYLGISTGILGRTLGKLVCRLRVENESGGRVGLWRGLGRESFKVLLLWTQIGAMIAAIQILMGRRGFHDSLCGTDVEFIGELTATQKAWRKNYGRY